MTDIIYFSLIIGLFAWNIYYVFQSRKQNNFVYRVVYFSRHWDWLLAIMLVAFIISACVLVSAIVPAWMNWSWLSLLGKDSANANIEIFFIIEKISSAFIFVLYAFFLFLLPKVAYMEEYIFRRGKNSVRQVLLSNFIFGMVHCIVGVQLWVGLVLIVFGLLLSLKYIFEYRKNEDRYDAMLASTSLHGKYNTIVVSLIIIALMLR